MNHLALLLVVSAALVMVGQWISLRAFTAAADRPSATLPPRLHARLSWWAAHRAPVAIGCAVVAAGGIVSSLLSM